ncbi:hypothetical protein [Algivirga pacifica]|uniref:Peptidase M15A C-terminal domain-containing protein n=1 Tax=Algivirga pacifica TaxID=1162670 RepID=A0ABP9D6V9_9BACT
MAYNIHTPSKRTLWALKYLLKPLLLFLLPIYLLIRGSVFLYQYYEWNTWIALGLTYIISLFLCLYYTSFLYRKVLRRQYISMREFKITFFIMTGLTLFYCGASLITLPIKNHKVSEIRKEYTSLHPFLRLGVRTLLWIDRDLLITDAERAPEDYRKMGLPSKKRSLHYTQSTGYVHAMDIRVSDRWWIRNRLVQLYFWTLGFNAVRHGGTGDHLHISLSLAERPEAW